MDALTFYGTAAALAPLMMLGALVLAVTERRYRHTQQRWLRTAQRLGLTVTRHPAAPTGAARGKIDGVEVALMAEERHEGTSPTTHTCVVAQHGVRLGLGLRIERARDSALSGRRVKTGDAAFDAAFHVHARDTAAALRAITPELRRALLALDDRACALTVTDTQVRWRCARLIVEDTPLRDALRDTARVTRAQRDAQAQRRMMASTRADRHVGASSRPERKTPHQGRRAYVPVRAHARISSR